MQNRSKYENNHRLIQDNVRKLQLKENVTDRRVILMFVFGLLIPQLKKKNVCQLNLQIVLKEVVILIYVII